MKTTAGYSASQILLHWAVALGIVFNYIVSDDMGRALRQAAEGREVTVAIAPFHIWIGVVVLALAAARIVLRLVQGGPPAEPGILGKFAAATHGLLYVLILLVPLSGAVAWFAGVEPAGGAHGLLANLLIILAALHAAAGLYHHVVLKDGVLRRMLRPA